MKRQLRMRKLFDGLDRLLRALAIAIVLGMLAVLALQVGMRYLGGRSLSWSEELSLLGFSWVVVLASALGLRSSLHARMSALIDALPGRSGQALERAVALLVAALGAAMALAGWDYLRETRGMVSASIGYPVEILHAAAPVFGLLVLVFSLERAVLGPAEQS